MAKPDYVIMMPSWYPRLSKMRAILRPVHEEVVRGDRTIAAGIDGRLSGGDMERPLIALALLPIKT